MKVLYRPDIDGLRAVAIVSVILYHIEFQFGGDKLFPGGYLGVDVFFVISGYLITSLLIKDLAEQQRVNYLLFYERRARRLLPALLLMILATVPAAWILLYPEQLIDYAKSIPASILFASNFYWHFSLQEYGAESSLSKPLLHTWSLAVEEQFYLLYPVMLLCIHRFAGTALRPLMLLLALVSFAYGTWMSTRDPSLAFYMLPSRLWELIAGGLLAAAGSAAPNTNARPGLRYLPTVGLIAIVMSTCLFEIGPGHPGYLTLVPVLGTLLVIACANPHDPATRLLSTHWFVGTGLISYSLYLWHYPIFAFGRHMDGTPSIADRLVWLALTLACSLLSYYLVEKPSRNRDKVPLRTLTAAATLCTVAMLGVSFTVIKKEGFSERFAHLAVDYNKNDFDNLRLKKKSWSLLRTDAKQAGYAKSAELADYEQLERWFSDREDTDKILVIGNSHGKDIYNAIKLNLDLFGTNKEVARYELQIGAGQDKINELLASPNFLAANTIVIASRFQEKTALYGLDGRVRNDLEALPPMIALFRSYGKRVLMTSKSVEFKAIHEEPVFDWFVTNLDKNNLLFDFELSRLYYDNRDTEKYVGINVKLKALASEHAVPYLDRVELVCDDSELACEGVTPDGYKIYYDYGHLTLEGAKYLGQKIDLQDWL